MSTRAELERTFRDVIDPGYTRPLEELAGGLGFDAVAAAAVMLARVSRAIARNRCAWYLLPHAGLPEPTASGARMAEGAVRLVRLDARAPLTVPARTPIAVRLRDSRGAWREDRATHHVAEAVAFDAGELEIVALARATRPGEGGNAPAGALVALVPLEGDVQALSAVRVVQAAPLTGGRHASLEAIGRERGLGRLRGEDDLAYAYRLSDLSDVVSPRAIERLCAQILVPAGIPYELLETQLQLTSQICDHSPLDVGNVGALDPEEPWRLAALLSEGASKRFFVVVVDPPGPAPRPAGYGDALAALWSALEGARMGGVPWRLVERGSLPPGWRAPGAEPEPADGEAVTVEVQLADPAREADLRAAVAAEYAALAAGEALSGYELADRLTLALGEAWGQVLGVAPEVPAAGQGGRLVLGALVITPLDEGAAPLFVLIEVSVPTLDADRWAAVRAAIAPLYAGLVPGQVVTWADVQGALLSVEPDGAVIEVSETAPTAEQVLVLDYVEIYYAEGPGGEEPDAYTWAAVYITLPSYDPQLWDNVREAIGALYTDLLPDVGVSEAEIAAAMATEVSGGTIDEVTATVPEPGTVLALEFIEIGLEGEV